MNLTPGQNISGQAGMENTGVIVSVRGSIVDIRLEDYLPPVYSLLHAGKDGDIAIEAMKG